MADERAARAASPKARVSTNTATALRTCSAGGTGSGRLGWSHTLRGGQPVPTIAAALLLALILSACVMQRQSQAPNADGPSHGGVTAAAIGENSAARTPQRGGGCMICGESRSLPDDDVGSPRRSHRISYLTEVLWLLFETPGWARRFVRFRLRSRATLIAP